MLNYIKNEDAIWHVEEYETVIVGTTIYNMLTNGFQGKIRMKYPYLPDEIDKTPYASTKKYGTNYYVEGTPNFCFMFICGYPHKSRNFLNYDALRSCLELVNRDFVGVKCMMTVPGDSHFDGNGDRKIIDKIMKESLTDVDIDVYDYVQMYRREEAAYIHRGILELRYTDREKFRRLWPLRTEIAHKLYINL